jgi:hypothetical protein
VAGVGTSWRRSCAIAATTRWHPTFLATTTPPGLPEYADTVVDALDLRARLELLEDPRLGLAAEVGRRPTKGKGRR